MERDLRPHPQGYFYPRPPRGGRRGEHRRKGRSVLHHFYPRPPRGGRHRITGMCAIWPVISIHALREEGDAFALFAGL